MYLDLSSSVFLKVINTIMYHVTLISGEQIKEKKKFNVSFCGCKHIMESCKILLYFSYVINDFLNLLVHGVVVVCQL